MTPRSHLTAALIAGGRSTRMGRHKALVEIDGQPMWRRQMTKLEKLHPLKLLFSHPPGLPGLEGSWFPITDLVPDKGPLGGLHAALQSTPTPLLVVLAVDLIDMTVAYLDALIEQADDDCGIVPERDGRFECLAAVYPSRIRPLVAEIIDGCDLSLQSLARCGLDAGLLRPKPVSRAERPLFRNVNRPSDLGHRRP